MSPDYMTILFANDHAKFVPNRVSPREEEHRIRLEMRKSKTFQTSPIKKEQASVIKANCTTQTVENTVQAPATPVTQTPNSREGHREVKRAYTNVLEISEAHQPLPV